MTETSEFAFNVVTCLGAFMFILVACGFIFAERISKFINYQFPGLSLSIAELLLLIEVRKENFGGKSYYSKTLQQFVKRKKIYELASTVEKWMITAIRIFIFIVVYLTLLAISLH